MYVYTFSPFFESLFTVRWPYGRTERTTWSMCYKILFISYAYVVSDHWSRRRATTLRPARGDRVCVWMSFSRHRYWGVTLPKIYIRVYMYIQLTSLTRNTSPVAIGQYHKFQHIAQENIRWEERGQSPENDRFIYQAVSWPHSRLTYSEELLFSEHVMPDRRRRPLEQARFAVDDQ